MTFSFTKYILKKCINYIQKKDNFVSLLLTLNQDPVIMQYSIELEASKIIIITFPLREYKNE